MKKVLAVLLALVLVLTACGGNSANDDKPAEEPKPEDNTGTEDNNEDNNENEGEAEEPVENAGEIAKVGLGTTVSLGSSKGKADGGPLAQTDTTVAAVAFDADGKIVKVIIDTAQDKVMVNEDGTINQDTDWRSKKELGPDYNMKPTSEEVGIGKEWDEQVAFLEDYLVGKTADEFSAVELDEGVPTDEDILTGATIKIGSFQMAVADAWENAQDVEGAVEIGLGISSALGGHSKDAEDGNGPVVQIEDNISMIALDADGKIVASQTDVAQNSVAFTEDLELDGEYAEGTTKRQLGPDYNMKPTSEEVGIGKEWDEQAKAYDEWLMGKTADDVAGIELEDGKATDEDLLAGATITISDFVAATTEAFEVTK